MAMKVLPDHLTQLVGFALEAQDYTPSTFS